MKKLSLTILFFLIGFCLLESQEIINNGRISGYVFGDFFYNAARDSGITDLKNVANGGNVDLNGVQLRRIYFTYDYDISNSFTTRFRIEADQSANTSNGKIGVFVKDAYLKWKDIFSGSDLIFGIQPTPTFEISEGIWGNRFLEKTIMDLRGVVPSRDLALALKGNFDYRGMLKYWLMIGNGTGNKPETDKYKSFYAHIQFSPIKQFTATIYADLKSRPKINDPSSKVIPPDKILNDELTYALFVGYNKRDQFSVGLEGFINQLQNGMTSSSGQKDKNGIGWSAFGSFNFSKELALVGRYDYYDPNTNEYILGDARNWFIFSLIYQLDKKVTISPNVIIETYESIPNVRSIDASVTPRITIFYTFL